jgi:hypothetical protein
MKHFFVAVVVLAVPGPAIAQSASGSAGCTVITQAAADGVAARIQSDDGTIRDPISVKNLTCLDNFFNGFGLNLIANVLDPTALLNNVEGKICSLVGSTLHSLTGTAQCGLTITGFNLGFGGLGGGSFCPKLSFGGGGPTWATFGTGATGSGGGGFYINGAGVPPTGYPLQPNSGAY